MAKLLIALLCLATVPALADETDNYAACLIGQSAVALQKQSEKKDIAAAQEIAYSICKEPRNMDENEAEGLSDFVNLSVEGIVTRVWGQ